MESKQGKINVALSIKNIEILLKKKKNLCSGNTDQNINNS